MKTYLFIYQFVGNRPPMVIAPFYYYPNGLQLSEYQSRVMTAKGFTDAKEFFISEWNRVGCPIKFIEGRVITE